MFASLIYYLSLCCFSSISCYSWSDNLYVKLLKYSVPTNYSIDGFGTNFQGREIRFLPFIFYTPELNDESTRILLNSYVGISWPDPQLRKWDHLNPKWFGVKEFPLTNFDEYPKTFPSIYGVDKKSSNLYIHSDGRMSYWAKYSRYVDCYRRKDSEYPKEVFQCNHDWRLVDNNQGTLTCFNFLSKSEPNCNSVFNGSSYLTDFMEKRLQRWIIRITHQSLDNPPRLRFSITFARKVDNQAIIDYGISYYVIVMIILQMIVHCNRIERLILGLLTIFDLLIGLNSLEKLTAVRDDPSLKIIRFHKCLIVIQSILLVQSLILYSLVSLYKRLPVPSFVSGTVYALYDQCLFIRQSTVTMDTFDRVISKIHSRRLNVDDYIIDPHANVNVTVTNEAAGTAGLDSGFNKGINVGFYDDDCESNSENMGEASNGVVKEAKDLSWITVCWFIDLLSSFVIIVALIYSIIKFI